MPLAVAASNEIVVENGKRERVRTYPWGKMYIERDSEFSRLRDLVLRSNMLSLVECTNREHYEKYREEVTSGDKQSKEEIEFKEFKSLYDIEKARLLKELEKLERENLIHKSPLRRPTNS